jgi:2-dehydro-3-deoxyphosphooctonate aldolase (KDO 8-P synthase)
MPTKIKIDGFEIGLSQPLAIIAGPCAVESEEIVLKTAGELKRLSHIYDFPLIFKSSYKKANRTSHDSFTTIGMQEALKILQKVKDEFGLPVLTDIHTVEEAEIASDAADILQIPAFLCRQTDLIVAAAKTGKAINIKKGQFMAPEDMGNAAQKAKSTGNDKVMLTERGTTFGYHNLVVDFKSLVIMRSLGYPVVYDCTHSVQLPSGSQGISGGQPQYILPLARAAVAVGCDALFIETHPEPSKALSDAESQLPLAEMENFIKNIRQIRGR